MTADEKAAILKAINPETCGISELIRRLRWKPTRVIELLNTMDEEGLIVFLESANHRRGRPKKIPVPTASGRKFLETYKTLALKCLKARKADFRHATEDALYVKRLVNAGHSPFRLFLELNEVVFNIKNSAKTSNTL
jgi:DNA-binding MarR family transcriptional regulator